MLFAPALTASSSNAPSIAVSRTVIWSWLVISKPVICVGPPFFFPLSPPPFFTEF